MADERSNPENRPTAPGGASGEALPERPTDPGRADIAPEPYDEVEEASMGSFPASDPPSWTHLAAGPPERPAPPRPRGQSKPGAEAEGDGGTEAEQPQADAPPTAGS